MRCICDATSPPCSCSFMVLRLSVKTMPTLLERRQSDGCRGVLDRYCESYANENVLLRRIENGRDDADDFAVGGDERPAGAAGVRGGVKLDQIGQKPLAFR